MFQISSTNYLLTVEFLFGSIQSRVVGVAANAMPIYKEGGGCLVGFKLFRATQE